jgi:SH3 domain protein
VQKKSNLSKKKWRKFYMKKLILFSLFFLFFSVFVNAETMFVTGIKKITFRTGPGNEYKILKQITLGEKITLIEKGDTWSKCKLENEEEGWILNTFISSQAPVEVLYNPLKKKYNTLINQYSVLKKKNDKYKFQNDKLLSDASANVSKIRELSTTYKSLEKRSAEYLQLEELYKKLGLKHTKLKKEIEGMGDQLTKKNIWWFFGGAGILLIGIIMGSMTARRKGRSSYL